MMNLCDRTFPWHLLSFSNLTGHPLDIYALLVLAIYCVIDRAPLLVLFIFHTRIPCTQYQVIYILIYTYRDNNNTLWLII